jgi:hypothetical protein
MDANFSSPLSQSFTKVQQGATFEDAKPKSLLRKLMTQTYPDCMLPVSPHPCSWRW